MVYESVAGASSRHIQRTLKTFLGTPRAGAFSCQSKSIVSSSRIIVLPLQLVVLK